MEKNKLNLEEVIQFLEKLDAKINTIKNLVEVIKYKMDEQDEK
jgi:hypothetical protein